MKIYRLSGLGGEQLVRLLYPDDFTGELALFKETVLEILRKPLKILKFVSLNEMIYNNYL